jgi:hypothetical protein
LIIPEALQKPGFFKEFLGGQVCVAASLSKDIRARKQTCLTTKLLKKTVFEELPSLKKLKNLL